MTKFMLHHYASRTLLFLCGIAGIALFIVFFIDMNAHYDSLLGFLSDRWLWTLIIINALLWGVVWYDLVYLPEKSYAAYRRKVQEFYNQYGYMSPVVYPAITRAEGRTSLPIFGPPQFKATVERVLQELRDRAPQRYQEVLTYLSKAEFIPRGEEFIFSGRADGLFTLDGNGDYGNFRWVFLHEVGHCVKGKTEDNWSEDAANAYTHQVIAELDR